MSSSPGPSAACTSSTPNNCTAPSGRSDPGRPARGYRRGGRLAVSWEAGVRGLAVVVVGVGGLGVHLVVVGPRAITLEIRALVRPQRYITSLRQRGWTFVNSPTFDA